jgi:hypothetical protein
MALTNESFDGAAADANDASRQTARRVRVRHILARQSKQDITRWHDALALNAGKAGSTSEPAVPNGTFAYGLRRRIRS